MSSKICVNEKSDVYEAQRREKKKKRTQTQTDKEVVVVVVVAAMMIAVGVGGVEVGVVIGATTTNNGFRKSFTSIRTIPKSAR